MAQLLEHDSDVASNPTKDIKGPHSLLPKVADLDSKAYPSEEALLEDIVKSIQLAGGCIVRGMLDKETLDAIESEIRPYILAQERWSGEGKGVLIALPKYVPV